MFRSLDHLGVTEREPKTLPPGQLGAAAVQARIGADGLLDDLTSMRHGLLATRHAAYHRLVGILMTLVWGPARDDALVANFERVWRTRSFPTFYERPLLILAALRADALQEGKSHPLHGALAAATPDPDAVTPEAVTGSLARNRLGVWSTMTSRRVQTNDTSRAIAWLWPAFLAGCDRSARQLALVDIGAGSGLNLIADQLPVIWSDLATGKEMPCAMRVDTVARIGFDSRPLNVQSEDDVHWMRSCIWPGDTNRLARFEVGVRALRTATRPARPVLERLTASLVPERLDALAASLPATGLLLAYQTLLAGYLEPSECDHYRTGMSSFVSRQSPGRALWVELELDDARRRLPGVLTAHVRTGDGVRSLRVGRSSQHPTEIEVDAGAVAELTRLLTLE